MTPAKKLYKYHSENLRAVNTGMERVARTLRQAIATQDMITLQSLLRLYALLLGAWAECRLKKLLYEPAFDAGTRQVIRALGSQHERWLKCIELGFRKRYAVPAADLSASVMPFSAFARFDALKSLIEGQVKPVIELRNRLAHGQWFYLLSADEENVSPELIAAVKKENLLTLQFKQDLMNHTSALINDLMVSNISFERDFDKHYKLVENTRLNLRNRSYADYAQLLRRKYLDGRVKYGAAVQAHFAEREKLSKGATV